MNYRFSFDDQIYADFIAFIRQKANDGSESAAMKKYVADAYAIECDRKLTCTCQKVVTNASNESEAIDSDEINLSGLDKIFKDM